MLVDCGKTIDNKIVLAGVYSFYETYGLPLDVICEELLKRNYVPAWDVFYIDAIKAGVSERKIIAKVFECVNSQRKSTNA